MVSKAFWVVSFPRCTSGPNTVGSCWIRLPTTASTYATTPTIVVPTMLGVVASVWPPLPALTQQLPPLLSQPCWELLHPFAHHCQHLRNNSHHCCPNHVGSCCIRLPTTASTYATTPTIVVPTMLGVVASVCPPLPALTQQLPPLLSQPCWELLRLFARSFRLTRALVPTWSIQVWAFDGIQSDISPVDAVMCVIKV